MLDPQSKSFKDILIKSWKSISIILLTSAIIGSLYSLQQANIGLLNKEIKEYKEKVNKILDSDKKLALEKDILGLERDLTTIQNGAYVTIVQLMGGIVLGITAWVGYQNFKIGEKNLEIGAKNLRVSEDKQVTERFSRSIEHLGTNDKVDVQLGGIYALEQIAIDAPKYRWTIVEILSAYIRGKCSNNSLEEQPKNVAADIQAALNVIVRRNIEEDPPGKRINLRKVKLPRVEIPEGNLNNANLSEANLSEANLSEAILTGANLSEAILGDVDLSRAQLRDVNLSNANLSRAKLNNANLSGANLNGANLSEANLSKAILKGAILNGANLNGADLNEADLSEAKLNGADLSEAKLNGANLWCANLRSANLSEAKLNGANLWCALLSEANLSKAILRGANLSEAILWSANLSEANLRGANLSEAKLSEANLRGANLSGVLNFTWQQIKRACYWEQAIYVEGNEPENDEEVEKMRNYTASNPKLPPDCSRWEVKT